MVIGPALRRIPAAWLGVGAHTASRQVQTPPDEAKTGRHNTADATMTAAAQTTPVHVSGVMVTSPTCRSYTTAFSEA
jgi:hypothetical protein